MLPIRYANPFDEAVTRAMKRRDDIVHAVKWSLMVWGDDLIAQGWDPQGHAPVPEGNYGCAVGAIALTRANDELNALRTAHRAWSNRRGHFQAASLLSIPF